MSVKDTVISGTKWTTASTLCTAIVQILRVSILARFLEKSDFGVVAIVTLIFGLVETFGDLGFSTAIMHKKDIKDNEFSSLFWMQLLLFVGIYLVSCLFTGVISDSYGEPALMHALPVALSGLILFAIGKLYDTVLQKQFQFKVIAIRNIVAALLSLVVAVVLAVLGAGLYSLIISTLLQTLIVNVWNFAVGFKQYRIKFYINFKEVLPLIKIGIFQTGTQIIDYLASRLDILLIGKFLGTEMLGVYNLAKDLLIRVFVLINTIANKVALPVFSYMQDDNQQLRDNYCKLIKTLSFVTLPFLTMIGALSAPLVIILYGNKFVEVIPLMTLLAIAYLFSCIGNPVGNIITAKGRTDISFIYTIIRMAISIPIVWITASMGTIELAVGQIILGILGGLLSWYMELWKIIGLRLSQYLKSFIVSLTISMVVILVGYYFVKHNYLSLELPIYQVIVYAIPVFLLYVILQLVFNRKQVNSNVELLKKMIIRVS